MAYQPLWLFNAKAILLEEQQWYYLTHSWEDKGVHTFLKSICLRVNVIARLSFLCLEVKILCDYILQQHDFSLIIFFCRELFDENTSFR